MAVQGGPAMNVVVDTSPGAQVEGGSAIPVAVVTGRAVTGNKATRVVVVTNPDHIEGGPAIPVVAAPAGDPVEGGPAMRVYVVAGSLGGAAVAPPVNTVAPSISGTAVSGQTLTGNHGTYTGTVTSYAYRWLRNGVAIVGATNQTYVASDTDNGTTITFEETATGPGGSAAPATSAGVTFPTYWLLDRFTTAASAPLSTPRSAEPTGTLTLVQTDGQLSISSAALNIPAQSTPAWGDLGFRVGAGKARAAGVALVGTINFSSGSNANWGWGSTNAQATSITGNWVYAFEAGAAGSFGIVDNGEEARQLFTISNGTAYQYAIVLRGTGAFYFVKGGAFTSWTLLWVSVQNNAATLYPQFNNYDRVGTLDNLTGTDFGSPWTADNGIATSFSATPAANSTAACNADAFITFTWTVTAGETLEIRTRYLDDNNCMIVRASEAGDTVKLIEKNAGVEIERATAAVAMSAGNTWRFNIVQDGATITLWMPQAGSNPRWRYASATFQQTQTGSKVAGFATGANFGCYPRTISLPNF